MLWTASPRPSLAWFPLTLQSAEHGVFNGPTLCGQEAGMLRFQEPTLEDLDHLLTVAAFYRPGELLAKAVGRVTTSLQHTLMRRYLDGLRSHLAAR